MRHISNTIKLHKELSILLLFSLIIRILIFYRFEPWDETNLEKIILIFDSLGYHNLGICILNNFSFCNEAFRTPGYPFFISIIYKIFGPEPQYVLFIQIFINLFSIILIYKIGRELFNKKAGLIAAIFFSIDLHQTIFIYYLLTESLFALTFMFAFYYLIKGLKNPKISYYSLAGIFYGLSTLIRPITQYYILALLIFILLWYYKAWKSGLKFSFFILAAYLVIILPWCFRNYSEFGYFKLSNIKGYSFLFWDASYYESKRRGITIEEVNNQFYEELYKMGWRRDQNPFIKEKYLLELAQKTLEPNFKDYLKTHLIGTIKIHLSLGTQSLTDVLHIPAKKWTEEEKYTNGVIALVKKFFATKTNYEIIMGLFVAVFLAIVYFFALIGIWRLVREKQVLIMLFLLGSAGYFALISGIVSYARYRLPSIPFYILLASVGIVWWLERRKSKVKTVISSEARNHN